MFVKHFASDLAPAKGLFLGKPDSFDISDMYSHTKHEFCGLDSFEVTGKCEVFTLCFGRTDSKKHRRTPVKLFAPYLLIWGA